MRLVIDIDDEDYQFIKDTEFSNFVVTEHLYEAVYEGITLPKGHGRIGDLDIILTWLVFKGIINELKCEEVASVFRKATILETNKESE